MNEPLKADDLAIVIDGLNGLEGPETWKPISTAPKDGTHIIAAYAKRNVFASRRIWANIVKWDCTYNGWVDDETEHVLSDKMYSHWMPLLPIGE